jgi:hypothetical protein
MPLEHCTCGTTRHKTGGVYECLGLDGLAHRVTCWSISGDDILPCNECGEWKPRATGHTGWDCVRFLRKDRDRAVELIRGLNPRARFRMNPAITSITAAAHYLDEVDARKGVKPPPKKSKIGA